MAQAAAGAPVIGTDAASQDAYAQYWAAYGYDVNSPQFKEWMAQQQAQYSQYYATYASTSTPSNTATPAPPSDAPPPPPS